MELQQTLWPANEPAAPGLWEDLDGPARRRVLAALARLIAKAVQPDRADSHREDTHER